MELLIRCVILQPLQPAQVLKFDVVVVFNLTKRINGLDLAFGAHGFKKGRYKCLWFFVSISKSMMIKRLKFGPIIVHDLLNISNGLDHDFWWLNLQKKKKTTLLCTISNLSQLSRYINYQKRFYKYLKIHLDLEAHFWTWDYFWPSKENQQIGS